MELEKGKINVRIYGFFGNSQLYFKCYTGSLAKKDRKALFYKAFFMAKKVDR